VIHIDRMHFITLIKFRKKASDVVEVAKGVMENLPKDLKITGAYWTLGRFDAVLIYEAPSEKEAMKLGIDMGNVMQTQTMVAIPREEAVKLL